MIDKRLKAAADLVRPNSKVCDVGTDHGYLACYLVENNMVNSCIASDINIKPLNSAKQTIENAGLQEKIELIRSDGLKEIPIDKADDIVICGMGGELIAKIIFESKFHKDKGKHFILQSMTNVDYLRKVLYENGYTLLSETPVIDKHHFYTVMSVTFTGDKTLISDIFAILGKIPESNSEDTLKYIEYQLEKTQKVIDGLKKSKNQTDLSYYISLKNDILKVLGRFEQWQQ